MAFRGCLAVAALLLVPAALADSQGAPLPPAYVVANWTTGGVVVEWLPPADDGGHPIVAYWIERLDTDTTVPVWERIGTTVGDARFFLDAAAGTAYRVIAVNEAGQSPPATTLTLTSSGAGQAVSVTPDDVVDAVLFVGDPCSPVIPGSNPNPPFIVRIDSRCIDELIH
jgi:hypothetical protein